MKTNRQEFALRISVVAVQSALLALAFMLPAHADDAGEGSASELTTPKKTIEVGAGWVSRDSAKFGEYNGLENKGVYGIGNIDLRGGGAFDSNSALRWRLTGRNLGLESRDVRGEIGEQGTFRLNVGYDELLRNRSDTYQTPFLGAGGTHLVLPANWMAPLFQTSATTAANGTYPAPTATMLGLAATGYGSPIVANAAYICRAINVAVTCAANPALGGVLTAPYAVTAANTAMLAQNQVDLTDFSPLHLNTKRTKYDFGGSYDFSPAMQLAFSMRREDKNGLKSMGVVNSGNGGYATENAVIFPMVIDTSTDQFNASFNYTGKKSFFTVAYYGSLFRNNVKSMTIDNPYNVGSYGVGAGQVTQTAFGPSSAAISEEPDNSLHQFRFTGGFNLTPTTKAVVDASYARNSQNDVFVLDPGMFSTPTSATTVTGGGAPVLSPLVGGVPVPGALNNASLSGYPNARASADAKVISKTFDFKLTSRPVERVSLSAAYKYEDRDNQTPVNSYIWYDAGAKNFINGAFSPLNGATVNGVTIGGTPATAQSFNLYSGVNITANRPYSKSMNRIDLDAEFAIMPGHAIKVGYEWLSVNRYCNNTWIDCSYADQSKENTLKAEYRFVVGETVSGRIGYDQSVRNVNYNANAWESLNPALGTFTNIPSLVAQGWNGSVQSFLYTYGLTPNGLPIAANQTPTLTPVGPSPLSAAQATAIYNLLFGNGNGSLNSAYYGNRNTTDNWAGLNNNAFDMANRNRSRLRGAMNWQALETLGFQAGFDYRRDDYPANSLGLQESQAWAFNFDGAFTPNEDLAIDAYYTREDQRVRTSNDPASNGTVSRNASAGTAYNVVGASPAVTGVNSTVSGLCPSASTAGLAGTPTDFQIFNNNAKIDPCANWTANMRDRTDTVGMSFTKKHLATRNFGLSGDLSYSRSVTTNDFNGGFYFTNTLAPYAANVPAVFFIRGTSLPDVVTNSARVGLTGRYQLNKSSGLRIGYSVSWLRVNDYQYQTNQVASTSGTVMPTLEQAPSYVVHVIGISYAYSFQ